MAPRIAGSVRSVAFRSAKGRSFAERKTTNRTVRRFLPACLLGMATCWAAPLQAQTQGPLLADDLARVPEITYREPVNVPDGEKSLSTRRKQLWPPSEPSN